MLAQRLLSVLTNSLARGIHSTNLLPYTKEQQCQVLDVLNKSSEAELRKLLAPSLSLRVVHERDLKGPFSTLESVFSLKGVKSNSLLKFCDYVLYNKKENKPSAKHSALNPTISSKRIMSLNRIAAVDVCLPYVTYAVMDRHRTLHEVQQYIVEEKNLSRPSIPALYTVATEIYSKLAQQADIYIFDQPYTNLQNMSGSKMAKQLLESMLFTMLNFCEPDQPKVFQLKQYTVAKMFSLKLGSEQIACEPALWSCIQQGEIVVPSYIMQRLHKEPNITKEFFGLTILKCLAVHRLFQQ
ncbi:uncharacterized protein LOC111252042 [Varroa destructor]|uniref:Transcription elongation factor, mitochondrial n=1 Tax=Varroa destructor TaxID=109461 RepID=A0A7M7KS73_VARDE|nr:uncharacterized protein LOC111252042 [Varroa destructor]XP_022665111.1 uncharacterized protein LOC111252042 [Varroa destructor]XP_022665112.1 uncharacterized protein LOC111252042 [Varroa destructor]XP_022665113.1 uncharacterized protein LOC111252042 [Varroa destructor]